MKRISLLFAIVFFFTHLAYAQVPQGIPYQAAARNASGQALVNTAVKVRFSILDSVATGTVVYKETHSTTTNSVGLFNVNVGMGTPVTGTFNAINWGKNAKFMQMELDITGTGSSYVNMGTQQMLSVPYALYAGNAKNSDNTLAVAGNTYTPQTRIGFDQSTTWTCPAGVTRIKVELWGGGGAGGNFCFYNGNPVTSGLYVNAGGNGGKGGYNMAYITVTPGNVYQIAIGGGGSAPTAKYSSTLYRPGVGWVSGIIGDLNPPSSAADGGTSSFNNILFAYGGTQGTSATSTTVGVNGIDAAVVNYNYASQNFGARPYIPAAYLTPIPTSTANAGDAYYVGGYSGSGVNCGSCLPTSGTAGYCVISY
jgi:hypothetical protein